MPKRVEPLIKLEPPVLPYARPMPPQPLLTDSYRQMWIVFAIAIGAVILGILIWAAGFSRLGMILFIPGAIVALKVYDRYIRAGRW